MQLVDSDGGRDTTRTSDLLHVRLGLDVYAIDSLELRLDTGEQVPAMSRPCSICTHPDREAIDTALVIDHTELFGHESLGGTNWRCGERGSVDLDIYRHENYLIVIASTT